MTESQEKILTDALREQFLKHSQIEEGGMTPLHARYLEILEKFMVTFSKIEMLIS